MMGYAGARFQHDAGDTADRNVSADAGFVDHDKGAVFHVDLAFFDEDHRHAFFHRDGFEWWEHERFPCSINVESCIAV
jgi:hypothetical protein